MLYAIKSGKQIRVTNNTPPSDIAPENVRIVEVATEARLGQIQTRIAELKRIYSTILKDRFPTFELATPADLPKVKNTKAKGGK